MLSGHEVGDDFDRRAPPVGDQGARARSISCCCGGEVAQLAGLLSVGRGLGRAAEEGRGGNRPWVGDWVEPESEGGRE